MALNVGARSPGLSRFVLRACRPASVSYLETQRAESEARANVTAGGCVMVGRQQQVDHGVGPSSLFLPACRQSANTDVNFPGGMSGTHFRTFRESAAAEERREEDRGIEEQRAAGLEKAKGQKGGGERKPLWRPSEWREEKALRGELLHSLREWPPDADLDEKLPNGTIGWEADWCHFIEGCPVQSYKRHIGRFWIAKERQRKWGNQRGGFSRFRGKGARVQHRRCTAGSECT